MYQQGSKEWHEWRSQGIGASEAPNIMGVGYLTPHQLWCNRLGLTPKKQENSSMKRGQDLEPVAREEFTKQTGIKMNADLRIHPEIQWMRCSLDGISEDGQILEIKCPNRERHQMALDGVIPPEYFPQIQHQIEVCGVKSAFFFSFNGISGKVLEIERDDKYISNLISKESDFWYSIQNLEPPELLDKDYRDMNSLEWELAAQEWIECKNILDVYEVKEKDSKSKLIELANGSNCKGSSLKLSRSIRKGNINYHSIPELIGIDLEKFRKSPSEVWRISQS